MYGSEISRRSKLTETENRIEVTRGWEGRGGQVGVINKLGVIKFWN